MLNRKHLLIGLIVLFLISIYGWFHLRLGIDFEGGMLVTITSSQPLTISNYFNPPYRLNEKTVQDQYIYEVTIPNPPELEQAAKLRNDLSECVKEWVNAYSRNQSSDQIKNKCDALVSQLETLSGLQLKENATLQDYSEYGDLAYYKVLNNIKEKIISKFPNAQVDISTITPTLSKTFFEKMKQVFLLAIIFVSMVVLYIFRSLIPSLIVMSGALMDTFIVLGLMGLLGIPLSFSTFAALLVLLGYSLDTDVLLTSRFFKSRGEREHIIKESMSTGISMTTTGMLAFAILLAIGYVLKIVFYKEIATVVLMGLFVDIFTTWGLNAFLLEKLGEKK